MTERLADRDRLPGSYFDDLYARDPDPWNFESSAYEREKYEATLAARGPPRRRFARAFEAGCSIGVFTQKLAPRCDELLAVDLSLPAVERARSRLRGAAHVRVERRMLPEELPAEPFDLVLFSEILYYWSAPLLDRNMSRLAAMVAAGGSFVAVHWRPRTKTYPQLGDEVHDRLTERLEGLVHALSLAGPQYRLDRWDRTA